MNLTLTLFAGLSLCRAFKGPLDDGTIVFVPVPSEENGWKCIVADPALMDQPALGSSYKLKVW